MLPLKLVSNFHKETRHWRKGNKLGFIGNLHLWGNIIKLRGAQCFISGRLRSNNGYVAAKTSFETKQLLTRRMEMSRCISADYVKKNVLTCVPYTCNTIIFSSFNQLYYCLVELSLPLSLPLKSLFLFYKPLTMMETTHLKMT